MEVGRKVFVRGPHSAQRIFSRMKPAEVDVVLISNKSQTPTTELGIDIAVVDQLFALSRSDEHLTSYVRFSKYM